MAANLLALVIAAGALLVIARDLSRPPARPGRWALLARSMPFVLFAGLSLSAAARAPRGRHPFRVDLDLSWNEIARSLTKLPHLRGFAVLVLLAVVAFGARRLLLALAATMILGLACELAQATVVGHHARLADLAANLAGSAVPLLAIAGLRRACGTERPD